MPLDEVNELEWLLTADSHSQVAPHLHGTRLMIYHHPASVQQHFTRLKSSCDLLSGSVFAVLHIRMLHIMHLPFGVKYFNAHGVSLHEIPLNTCVFFDKSYKLLRKSWVAKNCQLHNSMLPCVLTFPPWR